MICCTQLGYNGNWRHRHISSSGTEVSHLALLVVVGLFELFQIVRVVMFVSINFTGFFQS